MNEFWKWTTRSRKGFQSAFATQGERFALSVPTDESEKILVFEASCQANNHVWDHEIESYKPGGGTCCRGLGLSADGELLAAVLADYENQTAALCAWHLLGKPDTDSPSWPLPLDIHLKRYPIALSDDKHYIAIGCYFSIELFSLHTSGREKFSLEKSDSGALVQDLAFLPSGKLLVTQRSPEAGPPAIVSIVDCND